MTTIQLTADAGAVIFDAESLLVQVKRRWADDWKTMPYLTALSAQLAVTPDMPRAEFVYHYGQIKREDSPEYVDFDPLSLSNWYVRVMIDSQQVFVGVLTDDRFDLLGALNNQPAGDQAMTAYGLEHLLDRIAVMGAVTETGTISHTPTFNLVENYGGAVRGNRSDTAVGGVYTFANNDARWSNLDIIRYVLNYHADLGFDINLSGQFDVLADVYGVYWFEGLTIRQVLDKLIDRRRGLGWFVWSDGDTVSIHVFTVFERDIGLGDVQIPGNPQQVEINADALDVQEVTISQSESQLYDRIVVQGARAKTVFTVSLEEEALEPAWSLADETAYKNVSGSTNDERDAERESDGFAPVYQHFTLVDDWDELASDGMGDDRQPVLPAFNDLAQIVPGSSPVMAIRRPFSRTLPFYDENGDPVAPVVIGLASTESGERYVQIDGAGKVIGQAKSLVRMMDEKPGIVLRAGINHALAFNHFDAEVSGSDTSPVVDYETLLATVSLETDTRPSVEVVLNSDADHARTLVLTVHDAEFWYVTPDTVRATSNGALVRETGGAVRDDTAKLRYLAALASGWYGQKRSSITLTTRNLPSNLNLGSLVTSAASSWHKENIGTVLSSIDYDFVARTTTIRTGYAELDLQAMLDIPGMSDFRSVGRAFNRQQAQIKQVTDRLANMPVRYVGAAAVAASEDNEPGPVDFIVDNFDRGNSNGLGSYWQNSVNQLNLIDSGAQQVSGGSNNVETINLNLNRSFSSSSTGLCNIETNLPVSEGAITLRKPVVTYDDDGFESNIYNANYFDNSRRMNAVVTNYFRRLRGSSYSLSITLENSIRVGDYAGGTQSFELFGGSLGVAFSGVKGTDGTIVFDRAGLNVFGQASSLSHEAPDREVSAVADDGELAVQLWKNANEFGPYFYEENKPLNGPSATATVQGASVVFPAYTVCNFRFEGSQISDLDVGSDLSFEPGSSSSSTEIINITNNVSFSGLDIWEDNSANPVNSGANVRSIYDGFPRQTAAIENYDDGDWLSSIDLTVEYSAQAEANYSWLEFETSGGFQQAVFVQRNTLRLDVSGATVTAFLNGQQIAQSPISAAVAGEYIGLFSRMTQANLADYKDQKITQFKAWRADIPEPPDAESGHGNYDSDAGQYIYLDGYHVPDGDGGIDYVPTALD